MAASRALDQMYSASSTTEGYSDSDGLQQVVAKGLGYVVGLGSLLLYTPVAIRLVRQRHADGLVISTWWLKVFSYLLSDVYYLRKRYDLSTYAETLIITVEAAVVLVLVAWYQQHVRRASFWSGLAALGLFAFYGTTIAPESLVAAGQLASTAVNTLALVPQMHHNRITRSKGDYSPLTAGLAVGGCLIRLFTTVTLNDSDPVLMWTFASAVLFNGTLLLQILYYGVIVEGWSLAQVLLSDFGGASSGGGGPANPDPLYYEEGGVAAGTTSVYQTDASRAIPPVMRMRSERSLA